MDQADLKNLGGSLDKILGGGVEGTQNRWAGAAWRYAKCNDAYDRGNGDDEEKEDRINRNSY